MTYTLKAAGQAITSAAQRFMAGLDEDKAGIAYLNQATDRVDLELRMRELDRPRRTLRSYPTNFSTH